MTSDPLLIDSLWDRDFYYFVLIFYVSLFFVDGSLYMLIIK